MYLRWPQLHADINLQRVSNRFLPDGARYSVRPIEREIRKRITAARTLSTGFALSDSKEVDQAPRTRHNSDPKLNQEHGAQASAGSDGSWRSRDLRSSESGRVIVSSCHSQRALTTSAANRKSGGTAFGRGIRQGRSTSKMAPTGAAREQFYFQFITTPTSDTVGTTLLLHFNSKRYIFGSVSEGTQRACIQRGIGLKKVKHIFLSGKVEWRNTGGLIGMILTMADAQAAERESEKLRSASTATSTIVSRISEVSSEQSRSSGDGSLMIHGGENLMQTLACARGFVFRKGMPISVNEFEYSNEVHLGNPTWSDENIQVWAMPIAPSASEPFDSDDMESSDVSAPSPGTKGRKRSHDQFKREDDESIAPSSPGQHLRHQELRQSIVSDMFNSEWNRDALFEMPLADVKMPAALFVRDPETKKIVNYSGPKPGGEVPLPDIKILVRNPWPGALIEDLPPLRDLGFKTATSYIVQGYPQRGKFDPKKAKALGVPRGPLYSSLAAGNSVVLENGTIVSPDMVLGPTKPGRGIAIVELPSKRYVANLISRPEWTSEQIRNGIAAICWILAPGVGRSLELKKFMESTPSVEHIVSSADVNPNYLALDSSAASAIRLSRICKSYFPVPVHDNVTVPQLQLPHSKAHRLSGFTAADRGLKIQVEPEFQIRKDEIPPLLNTAEVVRNLPPKVEQYATLAREQIAAELGFPNNSDYAGECKDPLFDPEIITLGTGSALPSKYRNVSATLLRTGEYGNFLFDCGENTIGQLQRIFDGPTLAKVLMNLKFIWLSHLHADHHLGTVSVLTAQRHAFLVEARKLGEQSIDEAPEIHQRVVVASGSRILKFLEEYESVETLGNIQQLLCQAYEAPISDNSEEKTKSVLKQLGMKYLGTTSVEHCTGAQAISIKFANGFKFSYSGDCRPSVAFAKLGKGSDILVHEATFDDDMEGDALAKKHCTTGEALGVAAKMEAKNVILTHFSQRYQKLPVMENVKLPSSPEEPPKRSAGESPALLGEHGETRMATLDASPASDSKLTAGSKALLEMAGLDASMSHVPKLNMNICVAFDYMRVRVSDIKHMQKFTPALAALFQAEQMKQFNDDATPQAKSDTINRAKGSKRSQQSTNVGKNGSQKTGLEGGIPRHPNGSMKEQKEGKKTEPKQEESPSFKIRRIQIDKPDGEMNEGDNPSLNVRRVSTDNSYSNVVVIPTVDGPTSECLPPSEIEPNHPP